jgi:branched-chain amino acid transport system permease protein
MTGPVVDALFDSPLLLALALAYGLVYGVLRVMDLTLAIRAAMAGYCGWLMATAMSPQNPVSSPLVWLAALAGVLLVGLPSWALLRPFASATPLATLVGSLGLLNVMQAALQSAFGAAPRVFPNYPAEEGLHLLGTTATPLQLIGSAYVGLAAFGLFVVLKWTSFGKRLRTAAQDDEVAHCVFGVDLERLRWITMALASLVVAPAALLHCISHGVSPVSGAQQSLLAFVAAIVAGRGRPLGAAVVALILAVGAAAAVAWSLTDAAIALLATFSVAAVVRAFAARGRVRAGWAAASTCTGGLIVALVVTRIAGRVLGAGANLRLPTEYQSLIPYVIVVLALLWRPDGLLAIGTPRRA